MKQVFLALCAVTICSMSVLAQGLPDFLREGEGKVATIRGEEPFCAKAHEGSRALMARRPSAIIRRPYDVLSYTLWMDWRLPLTQTGVMSRRYTGRTTIRARIDSANISTMTLDLRELQIDSVKLDESGALTTFIQNTGSVDVSLGMPRRQGDTVEVTVYYTNVSLSNPGDYNGFIAVPAGPIGTRDTVYENIAYTMSQPTGARAWMPCNDRPYDKALSTITVVVPRGYSVSSNGMLSRYDQFSDREEYTWKDDVPITTYLMVVCASKWAKYDGRPYTRVHDSTKQIPVPVYLWPHDAEVFSDNLTWMQDITVTMLETYSKLYGEYPFNSYAQTLLMPYFMGAMEHQTNTTHHRRALTDRWEGVIAHELMHQWTGDKVTCATWNDIWLNEGGATYGEFLWIEHLAGKAEARKDFGIRRDRSYFGSDEGEKQPAVYFVPFNNLFNNGTTYVKGGWVYAMLRELVGDSTYFAVMNEYFRRLAYQSAETEDFVALWEEMVPQPKVSFRQFFDQWIYSPGHPYYSATVQSFTRVGDEADVVINFKQRPGPTASAPPIFVMPVPLRFHDTFSNATYDYVLLNDSLEHTVSIRVPFIPKTMVIDEDQTVLCIKPSTDIVVSVNTQTPDNTSQPLVLFPQPVERGSTIQAQYNVYTPSSVRIDVYDERGSMIERVVEGRMDAGTYSTAIPTTSYSPGVYMVRYSVGEKIFFSTFTVAR